MTDPLEEMAREIVQEYENELQFPKEDRFKDLEVKITEALKTLRSKTLEERPPFCIACEPRIEELKILQARIKELENEKHLENIRVVQAARILELEDKLKTIRSKTRKEDAEIFNLNELQKDWEENFYESDWEPDTLKTTEIEKKIVEELTTFLPRHMIVYDWNLPFADEIILIIRRHLAQAILKKEQEEK